MSIDRPEPATVRKSLPLTAQDQADLQRMMRSDIHRDALTRLSREPVPVEASEARVLHALLAAGMAAVREEVEEAGYAQLAAERDPGTRRRVARRRPPSWAKE